MTFRKAHPEDERKGSGDDREVTGTQRKIEVVVVVGGLVFLFGFLALVIVDLVAGIG